MKGTLINKRGKWFIQYVEVIEDVEFPLIAGLNKEIPLHPDDAQLNPPSNGFVKHVNVTGEPIEVEFEIVEISTHSSGVQSGYDDFGKTEKYAKLIQPKEDNFKSVREGIRQSTKQSGYSVYIPENAKKQEETKVTREETTTWEDILVTISNFQSKDPHKMDLVDWLKKHYNVPIKKK